MCFLTSYNTPNVKGVHSSSTFSVLVLWRSESFLFCLADFHVGILLLGVCLYLGLGIFLASIVLFSGLWTISDFKDLVLFFVYLILNLLLNANTVSVKSLLSVYLLVKGDY